MHPTTKISKARKLQRRSHHRLTAAQSVVCPNCGNPKLAHAACDRCGYVRPGLSVRLSKED